MYALHTNIFVILRVEWIEKQGNKYHVGYFIWCGYQDELPCFGKLFDILLIESRVIFCLCLYHTKGIDRHHNSFVINADPTHSKVVKIITDDDERNHRLLLFQPHSLNSSSGTLHIVSKYFILKI